MSAFIRYIMASKKIFLLAVLMISGTIFYYLLKESEIEMPVKEYSMRENDVLRDYVRYSCSQRLR